MKCADCQFWEAPADKWGSWGTCGTSFLIKEHHQ